MTISLRQIVAVVLLAVFVLVLSLAFLHFYSMLFGAMGSGAMESHTPCAAYIQFSETIIQTNVLPLLGLILILAAYFFTDIIPQLKKDIPAKKLLNNFFDQVIKPHLIYSELFESGILHPRLYA